MLETTEVIMHALVMASLVLSFWPGLPPLRSSKGDPLSAENIYAATSALQKLPNEKVGVTATPPLRGGMIWQPWNDGGAFPLEVGLMWGRVSVTVTKPQITRFDLHLIECNSEADAKKYFLQLRLLLQPGYARSGKYLLKGSPEALAWFVKHYGAVSYPTVPERSAPDK